MKAKCLGLKGGFLFAAASLATANVGSVWAAGGAGTPAGVVINEVLADPPSEAGDANGDGTRSRSQDEFVEIVNDSGATIDISGWELHDSVKLRHVFPDGTQIAHRCAVIVFGGGEPKGNFGGAIVQTASKGTLGLNNDEDRIKLIDKSGKVVAEMTYGPEGGKDEALTRSPDITGEFVGHTSVEGASGARFSPGSSISGNPFGGCSAK